MTLDRRRAALLCVLLALAGACGEAAPAQPATPQAAALEAAQDVVLGRFRDAEAAMFDGRFEEAARLFEAMADAVEATGVPELQGHRDLALYNAACCLARAGKASDAAAAFARSVGSGLRPARVQVNGAWIDGPSLRLEHILADPDLDAIRADPMVRESLRPYLASGDLVISMASALLDRRQPALLVLAAPDVGDVSELIEPEGGLVVAILDPPIAPARDATEPSARRWILGDGDERWALARIRESLDVLDEEESVAPARIYVAGAGPQSGTAALAAALAMPGRIAGVVVTGARFHPAGIADDLARFARADPRPRIAVGPADDALAAEFARAGITVERAATPADAIAVWLTD